MTEQAFKFRYKKSHLFAIIMSAVIAVGILCFLLAFGISYGWSAVLNWFASDYAILFYIFIGVYAIVLILFFLNERYKKL